jgi:uncharacterized repeat protein (TIGR03803 family)
MHAYTVPVLCAATAIALPAQTFTTLFSFDAGRNVEAGLVQASNGNLYGTTPGGGANGHGTVFKITPSGTLTTIYSFCPQSGCTDGTFANGLVQAADGNLYGTASEGGANGDGTVFKITPDGALTILHTFDGTDGIFPNGLVQAASGDFYGTTQNGGANDNPNCSVISPFAGCGTIFKITPSGTLTTLYSFCSQSNCTDGDLPCQGLFGCTGLVQATNGDFYGTTVYGGANGDGTVFKITPSGTLTTLHSFCSLSGCTDGNGPEAGLVQATNGDFYGTTCCGGANGWGNVFKITPSGTLTTLYSFCSLSGCADGSVPQCGLVQGTDGDLYGTTFEFGANGEGGTVFKVTLSGTLTTLYSFCSQSGCTDGASPYAGLVQDTNGTFYGTTGYGGADNDGTVFSVSVGLGPFVETQRTAGKVGEVVEMLGTDLTGATTVTFNGTAAAFTVASPSLIAARVPAGATSGKIQVVTPSGTLLSNVPFRVLP